MIKGLELLSKEKGSKSTQETVGCPVCGTNGGNGALCFRHAEMTKKYRWLMIYINSQEKFDKKTVYILRYAISDRLSLVINDVEIVNGKLALKEYLDEKMEKKKCSKWMETILKEIISLQEATSSVLKIIEGGSNNGNDTKNGS